MLADTPAKEEFTYHEGIASFSRCVDAGYYLDDVARLYVHEIFAAEGVVAVQDAPVILDRSRFVFPVALSEKFLFCIVERSTGGKGPTEKFVPDHFPRN